MDRRKFFEKIGIASLGVVVAPKIITEITTEQGVQGFDVEKIDERIKAIKFWEEFHGVVIPKHRRQGSDFITNYDLAKPDLIKNLYRKYGNQKMNYFQLLKSLNK